MTHQVQCGTKVKWMHPWGRY